MSTELGKPKKCILMKSGLALWVDRETAERFEARTRADDFQHVFVEIRELGQTINTSQIEGFYSPETYEEIQKIKAGMTKCRWGEWHKKITDCECAREARRREEEARRKREREAESTPPSPEERARNAEAFRKGNEEAALRNPSSIFRAWFKHGNPKGRKIRRSTIDAWEAKHGPQDVSDMVVEEDTAVDTEATEA